MARVLGVGGVFFKSREPKALAAWYARWLGLKINDIDSAIFRPDGLPPGAFTVWHPMAHDTDYVEPANKPFMINLIVDDLEQALAQVREGGGKQVGGIDDFDYGRFGWFLDPDGNKVELWQPHKTG